MTEWFWNICNDCITILSLAILPTFVAIALSYLLCLFHLIENQWVRSWILRLKSNYVDKENELAYYHIPVLSSDDKDISNGDNFLKKLALIPNKYQENDESHPIYVIGSSSGFGKSLLLGHIEKHYLHKFGEGIWRFPLYYSLKEFSEDQVRKCHQSSDGEVFSWVSRLLQILRKKLKKEGKVIYLFDGANEISTTEELNRFCELVRILYRENENKKKKNIIIITSNNSRHLIDEMGTNFKIINISILKLNSDEIVQFIDKRKWWWRGNETDSEGVEKWLRSQCLINNIYTVPYFLNKLCNYVSKNSSTINDKSKTMTPTGLLGYFYQREVENIENANAIIDKFAFSYMSGEMKDAGKTRLIKLLQQASGNTEKNFLGASGSEAFFLSTKVITADHSEISLVPHDIYWTFLAARYTFNEFKLNDNIENLKTALRAKIPGDYFYFLFLFFLESDFDETKKAELCQYMIKHFRLVADPVYSKKPPPFLAIRMLASASQSNMTWDKTISHSVIEDVTSSYNSNSNCTKNEEDNDSRPMFWSSISTICNSDKEEFGSKDLKDFMSIQKTQTILDDLVDNDLDLFKNHVFPALESSQYVTSSTITKIAERLFFSNSGKEKTTTELAKYFLIAFSRFVLQYDVREISKEAAKQLVLQLPNHGSVIQVGFATATNDSWPLDKFYSGKVINSLIGCLDDSCFENGAKSSISKDGVIFDWYRRTNDNTKDELSALTVKEKKEYANIELFDKCCKFATLFLFLFGVIFAIFFSFQFFWCSLTQTPHAIISTYPFWVAPIPEDDWKDLCKIQDIWSKTRTYVKRNRNNCDLFERVAVYSDGKHVIHYYPKEPIKYAHQIVSKCSKYSWRYQAPRMLKIESLNINKNDIQSQFLLLGITEEETKKFLDSVEDFYRVQDRINNNPSVQLGIVFWPSNFLLSAAMMAIVSAGILAFVVFVSMSERRQRNVDTEMFTGIFGAMLVLICLAAVCGFYMAWYPMWVLVLLAPVLLLGLSLYLWIWNTSESPGYRKKHSFLKEVKSWEQKN